jgi:hypothetical protein
LPGTGRAGPVRWLIVLLVVTGGRRRALSSRFVPCLVEPTVRPEPMTELGSPDRQPERPRQPGEELRYAQPRSSRSRGRLLRLHRKPLSGSRPFAVCTGSLGSRTPRTPQRRILAHGATRPPPTHAEAFPSPCFRGAMAPFHERRPGVAIRRRAASLQLPLRAVDTARTPVSSERAPTAR